MSETTLHRVRGVGQQLHYHDDEPFSPEAFEQAIHDLQALLITLPNMEQPTLDTQLDHERTPDHQFETYHDDESVMHIDEGTHLYDVVQRLPKGWDATVLTDLLHDKSYAVRTSADCGGGVVVYATIMVEDNQLRRLDIGHTKVTNRDEGFEQRNITIFASGYEIAALNRQLERSVTQAYAGAIENAAPAFDYLGTKGDITATWESAISKDDFRKGVTQIDWANVRGKTRQTVNKNVRVAREIIFNLPVPDTFAERRPALRELDEDADETGDLRLV